MAETNPATLISVHFIEAARGVYAACGQPLVQGIASTAVVEQVTCWQCKFKLETAKPKRTRRTPRRQAARGT